MAQTQAIAGGLKVWISGSIEEVANAAQSGLVSAVVTNPTIMAQWTAGGRYLEEVATEACRLTSLPLFIQLLGPARDRFVREAEVLRSISAQIHPKLPPSPDGLAAASRLEAQGIRTLVTAVCSLNQAYLAAVAGVSYICPYVARINAAGGDAQALIRDIAALYGRHGVRTEIVAASVRSPEEVAAMLASGAHGAIIFAPVFDALFQHEVTKTSMERFEAEDWSRIPYYFKERNR